MQHHPRNFDGEVPINYAQSCRMITENLQNFELDLWDCSCQGMLEWVCLEQIRMVGRRSRNRGCVFCVGLTRNRGLERGRHANRRV